MKKSIIIAAAIAIFATFWIVSGVVGQDAKNDDDIVAEEASDRAVTAVRVRTLEAVDMTGEIVITGRTRPARDVVVRAETGGRVTDIAVSRGQSVSEGGILARLDRRDRAERVAEARENLRQREVEFNAAQALETQGFNSRIALAKARTALGSARAAFRQAEITLSHTELVAPFDGLVQGKHVDPGDLVQEGEEAFRIVDLDHLKVTGFVTEKQVAFLTPGSKAEATFVSGLKAQGILHFIAPAANEETRTFEIEILIPNDGHHIAAGMTARMILPGQQHKVHEISPSILSLDDDGRVGVRTVDEDEIVHFYPVDIVADRPGAMYVGGLPQIVRVITVGQEFVMPGQTVHAVESDGDGLL